MVDKKKKKKNLKKNNKAVAASKNVAAAFSASKGKKSCPPVPPTKKTPKRVAAILEEIAKGASVRKACELNDLNPDTWYSWLAADKALSDQYARSKDVGLDKMADDILEIADDGKNDTSTEVDDDGHEYEKTNYDVIARSKLRVDTRKWLLSKLKPKKYGDRIIHAGDEENPLAISKIEVEIKRAANEPSKN